MPQEEVLEHFELLRKTLQAYNVVNIKDWHVSDTLLAHVFKVLDVIEVLPNIGKPLVWFSLPEGVNLSWGGTETKFTLVIVSDTDFKLEEYLNVMVIDKATDKFVFTDLAFEDLSSLPERIERELHVHTIHDL